MELTKGDDGGGTATHGGSGTCLEVVGTCTRHAVRPTREVLREVDVSIDTSGHYVSPLRVNDFVGV